MAQKKSFRAFLGIKMIVFTRRFFWDEKIFEKNFFSKSCFYCIFELLGFSKLMFVKCPIPIKWGPFNAILEAEGVHRAILDISEILSGTKNWIKKVVLNKCFFQNQRRYKSCNKTCEIRTKNVNAITLPNHLVIIKRGICTVSCSWWSFCRFFKKPPFGCSMTRFARCGPPEIGAFGPDFGWLG